MYNFISIIVPYSSNNYINIILVILQPRMCIILLATHAVYKMCQYVLVAMHVFLLYFVVTILHI